MPDERKRDFLNELITAELPYFAATEQIHTEMYSNKKIVIDGSFTVLEYSEDLVSLRLKKGCLQIYGTEMTISSVSDGHIVIIGNILSFEFGS